jgi:hypothetical protein
VQQASVVHPVHGSTERICSSLRDLLPLFIQ